MYRSIERVLTALSPRQTQFFITMVHTINISGYSHRQLLGVDLSPPHFNGSRLINDFELNIAMRISGLPYLFQPLQSARCLCRSSFLSTRDYEIIMRFFITFDKWVCFILVYMLLMKLTTKVSTLNN